MTPYAMYFDEADLVAEEKRILTAFTRSLIEIAALSSSPTGAPDSANALNILRQPAVLLDADGFVVESNVAAISVFSSDIYVKDRRVVIRDLDARAKLQSLICLMKDSAAPIAHAAEPIVVPRQEKLPVLLRIWPFDGAARWPSREVRSLLTLNALGPRPGPPAEILAKTFGLTPSEARLGCIIARGAGPDTAAQELKISRETARNQLKSIFSKTGTHRQSELVALLLQVQ